MSETEYGAGGYAWTLAVTPSAPVLDWGGSTELLVSIGEDGNPLHTEYAILNETRGEWLDAAGEGSATPVWRLRADWGTVAASGLDPATIYTFSARARNGDGVETLPGPPACLTTCGCGEAVLEMVLDVVKASSTITPPAFMAGLPASIRLAGKNLNDFGFHVDRITGLDLPAVVPDEELVPGDHAWLVRDEYFAPKRIVLEGHVHGSAPEDLRLRLAYLKSFLAGFEGSPWRSRTPVRLERSDLGDRHWMVFYESLDEIETLGKRDRSSSARIRVTVKSPLPFALSNEVVRTVLVPEAGGFHPLELGNAPSDAVYVLRGPATDPSFSLGDMIFLCNFSDGFAFSDVTNTTRSGEFDPADHAALACMLTETGMGILVSGADTVRFDVRGNPADGAWVAVVEPRWQSSSRIGDAVVLEHRADADNFLRLSWDAAACAWVFLIRAGGEDCEVRSPVQAFTAGTRIVLGITWDATNAGGMKLYIDGTQAAAGDRYPVLSSKPQYVTLHANDGSFQSDAVIDLVAGWSRMLSADEMLRIAGDPSALANRNVAVSWAGTLDEGDLLTIDSSRRTAEVFDVSAGVRVNALPGLAGEIPVLTPGRRRTATDRTQTMIHFLSAAAGMEVRYRRRYL